MFKAGDRIRFIPNQHFLGSERTRFYEAHKNTVFYLNTTNLTLDRGVLIGVKLQELDFRVNRFEKVRQGKMCL